MHHIFIEDINDEGPRVEYNEPVCNMLAQNSYVVIKGKTDVSSKTTVTVIAEYKSELK